MIVPKNGKNVPININIYVTYVHNICNVNVYSYHSSLEVNTCVTHCFNKIFLFVDRQEGEKKYVDI